MFTSIWTVILLRFSYFLLFGQREKEGKKYERTHYGTVDKYLNQNNTFVVAYQYPLLEDMGFNVSGPYKSHASMLANEI